MSVNDAKNLFIGGFYQYVGNRVNEAVLDQVDATDTMMIGTEIRGNPTFDTSVAGIQLSSVLSDGAVFFGVRLYIHEFVDQGTPPQDDGHCIVVQAPSSGTVLYTFHQVTCANADKAIRMSGDATGLSVVLSGTVFEQLSGVEGRHIVILGEQAELATVTWTQSITDELSGTSDAYFCQTAVGGECALGGAYTTLDALRDDLGANWSMLDDVSTSGPSWNTPDTQMLTTDAPYCDPSEECWEAYTQILSFDSNIPIPAWVLGAEITGFRIGGASGNIGGN